MRTASHFASRTNFAPIGLVVTGLLATVGARGFTSPAPAPPMQESSALATAGDAKSAPDRYRAPFYFERNHGQTDPQVRYMAQTTGGTVFLTDRESVLTFAAPAKSTKAAKGERLAVVRMRLRGSKKSTSLVGESSMPGRLNYFVGNDPKQWQENVPTFSKVRRSEVYPGVDVVYYGNDHQLEYDFEVAPGADPSQIEVAFDGVKDVQVNAGGDLLLETALGEVKQLKPVVYQESNGSRTEVESRYVVSKEKRDAPVRVAFALGDYDRSLTLIIDPLLVYGTYLGGPNYEIAGGIDVDGDGNAYVCGKTQSPTFPHVGGAFFTAPDADARKARIFVSKFNPQGTQLIYSSVFGGKHIDASYSEGHHAWGLAVTAGTGDPNKDRCVWVGGSTTAPDFPTTPNALMPAHPEPDILRPSDGKGTQWREGFLTKLGPNGNLVYSTYFGGLTGSKHIIPPGPICEVMDVATFGGGAFITGYTTFYDDPKTQAIEGLPVQLGLNKNVAQPNYGAPPNAYAEAEDAFVAAFSDNGVLQYCTYLGGGGSDLGCAIAVDVNGVAAVTGRTRSGLQRPNQDPLDPPFPTTSGAFQPEIRGEHDAFVTTVSQTGSQFFYSTYLGGSKGEAYFGSPPAVYGDIAVDPAGDLYVTGSTLSADFPTTPGAFRPVITTTNNSDAYVAKIRTDAGLPAAQQLVYSTFLGGSGTDAGRSIAWRATPDGFAATVAGHTTFSPDFPLVNPLFTANSHFVTQFNAAGSALEFSTRLGPANTGNDGNEIDMVQGIWGDVFATGTTSSNVWPTTVGAFQRPFGGGKDTWVMRLRPTEFQVQVTSCALTPSSLPASGGTTTISANVTSTIELDTVVARITGPAQQVQLVPLQLQGIVYRGTFDAPANDTTAVETYGVTIIGTDDAGTTGNRDCGNLTVAKGEVQVTSCSLKPNTLPAAGGAATITANVTSTFAVDSVIARITGAAKQVQDIPLQLQGTVYRGVFNAPANFTTANQSYHVTIIATDDPGNSANRDCGNLTVAAGVLVITQVSITPSELPSKGGRVKISATVAGSERVKSVKAVIDLASGGTKTVRLKLKRGVYVGKFKAPRNRKLKPMVYSVVVNAVGKEGTQASRNAGTFTVAAAVE